MADSKSIKKEKLKITSREDLSFVQRDAEGLMNNWAVTPPSAKENWGSGVKKGHRFFKEIEQLAMHNEEEAFIAIRCAIAESQNFSRNGRGIECGFSWAIAKAAIDGIRAKRSKKKA